MASYTPTGSSPNQILFCTGDDVTTYGIVAAVNANSSDLKDVNGENPSATFNNRVDEFTLNGAISGSAVTTIVVNGTIPAATNRAGTLHLSRPDGTLSRHIFLKFAGSTFTIQEADFSTNSPVNGASCDATSKGTSAFIQADIKIGNTGGGSTTWIIESEDVNIFCNDLLFENSLTQLGEVTSGGELRNGSRLNVDIDGIDSTVTGTNLEKWVIGDEASMTSYNSQIIHNSVLTLTYDMQDVYFEGCFLQLVNGVGTAGGFPGDLFTNDPTVTYKNCRFNNISSAIKLNQFVTYALDGLEVVGNTGFQPAAEPVILTNVVAASVPFILIVNTHDSDITFVNPDFTTITQLFGNASDVAFIQYSYDLIVAEADGTPIENARVWLEDEQGAVVFNDLTDSAGVPAVGTYQFISQAGAVVTDHSLHEQKIRAYGFIEIVGQNDAIEPFKTTLRKSVESNIVLSKAAAAALTGIVVSGASSTVTVSAAKTPSEIFDFNEEWAQQAGNMQFVKGFLTSDSINYSQNTGWELLTDQEISGGINFTGDMSLTAVDDLTAHNITGSLTFTTAGTYTLSNCTITELINTSGGAVTINLKNSFFTTNTGPSITINYPVDVLVTVEDAITSAPLQNSRVYATAAAGGDLPVGTLLINELTDVNGEVSVVLDFATNNDQPIDGRIRRSTTPPLYRSAKILGILEVSTGAATLIQQMILDE